MRKSKCHVATLLMVSLVAARASAATLSIEPATADVLPGSTVTLDFVISGLGDATAPSLGAFDIDFNFDPAVLTVSSYTLGDQLGLLDALEAVDVGFGSTGPGIFNIAEVSLLGSSTLDALQDSTFVIASVEFFVDALGAGQSTLVAFGALTNLADGTGDAVVLDGTTGAVLTGSAIPLPGGLVLLVSAIAALPWCRRCT